MARPWRIQYKNAVYHIMSSGVAQGEGEVFSADEDYDKFLEYLEKISEITKAAQWISEQLETQRRLKRLTGY